MKDERELNPIDEISRHHLKDRIFVNNPVVIQGMGLAALVVVATSAQNALMLAVAVLLLLTPTRVIAGLLLAKVESRLLRVMGYVGVAGILYIAVYYLLSLIFGVTILNLGIYLPMLVVEPMIIYRYARPQESVIKALLKGLRMTLGYAIVVLLVGCLREYLALGSLFGIVLAEIEFLPIAATPAGGLILLGLLCAVWRSSATWYRKKAIMKARELQ